MATTTDYKHSRRVRTATFTLTYADTTAALMLTLPRGVRILGYATHTKTAFASGTTQINIGTSSTATELVAAMSVAATGDKAPTTEVALPGYETTALTDIYAKVGASNTVGEVDVSMFLAMARDRRQ